MKSSPLLLIVTITVFGLSSLAAAQPSVTIIPGQYELSNNLTKRKQIECLKENKLTADYIIKEMNTTGVQSCKVEDSRAQGKTLEVDMSCVYGKEMTGDGRMTITVKGDSLDIKSAFTMKRGGETQSMEMVSVGKRIGGC